MKSIIYSYTKEELQEKIDCSNSIREALEKIGLRDVGGTRGTFYKVVEKLDLSLDKLKQNRENSLRNGDFSVNKKTNEELFCENSKVSRFVVKKRILKENILEYKCEKCGNIGEWLEEKLVLELEHKNGIGNDNRIENLSFLCPNCHSQTKTFAGKNYKHSSDWMPKDYILKRKEKEEEKEKRKLLSPEERIKINKINAIKGGKLYRKLNKQQVDFILKNKEKFTNIKLAKISNVSDKTIAKIIKNNGYVEEKNL